MIADKYDNVFKDGKLTHLMITRKGDRKYIAEKISYPLYSLLLSFLANYNIHLGGAVHIDDWEVKAVTIDTNFDINNELVLRELYSFSSGHVNIQLNTKLAQDCAFAFNYDLKDYSCTLEKYVYGTTKESVRYETLVDMLQALKEREKGEL